jgi:hypothetical protein
MIHTFHIIVAHPFQSINTALERSDVVPFIVTLAIAFACGTFALE